MVFAFLSSSLLRSYLTSKRLTLSVSLLTLAAAAIATTGIQASSVSSPDASRPTLASETSVTVPAAAASPPLGSQLQDPLNSPHPIPWQWIEETQALSQSISQPQTHYFRSHALISPDGQFAAYSRIQMNVRPGMTQDRVTSMLFLENLQTGGLRFVTASSPEVKNPNIAAAEYDQPGMIAVLTPVAWSEMGDRLLVRGFESRFGTDLASDYAVVWDRATGGQQAIVPSNMTYSNAVLLGWSQTHAGQVLFRAGSLGEDAWAAIAVNSDGVAIAAAADQPQVYGQISRDFWNGPQAYIGAQ